MSVKWQRRRNIVLVPLDKLKKSPKNVRKVPHTKGEIKALAASIAALGMLQTPIIEPELGLNGKPNASPTSGLIRPRSNLIRPEIVIFDDLYERARFIVGAQHNNENTLA